MSRPVYDHDGVRGNFRVVSFQLILERLVWVFLRGFLYNDSLGKRRRLRKRRRDLEEGFRGRTVDHDEKLGRQLRTRRSREGAQARDACHVEIENKFGGVQMTSYIEESKDSKS